MFSSLFKSLVQARNALYTLGVLGATRLDETVISVGNITVGGTGKTPLVATLAQVLIEDGERVCILTRGYGRKSASKRVVVADGESILASAEEGGDEPREMAERLDGKAFIVADADRVSAAEFATKQFKPTVFILDDGFQHRKILRDLDIVCVDATNPFGNHKTLPFGILREPVSNLRRAQKIVITRSNLVGEAEVESIKRRITDVAPESEIIVTTLNFTGFTSVGSDGHFDKGGRAFAFCGLGNPENFFLLLKNENINVAGTHSFRDHHRYSQNDLDNITALAKERGAEMLLTTAKDSVKLAGLTHELPCFSAGVEIYFPENEKLRLVRGAAFKK